MKIRLVLAAGLGLLVLAGHAGAAAGKSAQESFEAGLTAEQSGDFATALAAFQATIRADRTFQPDQVNWHTGLVQAKLGRPGPAIVAIESALRLNPFPNDPVPYRLLASLYLRQGRPGDAQATAGRGLKVHPTDPWLHEYTRDALARLKKPAEARTSGLKAEELMWKKPPVAGRTGLGLPFEGTWKVKAGNADGDHVGLAGRYAWDFVKVNDAGAEQDPKRDKRLSASWLGWDALVLAPADGEVVAVESAVADNVVAGTGYALVPLGNFVIIRHADGEFSVLGYLRKGSPAVKPGDKVKRGQVVGRCGNSGASLLPQLRFAMLSQADPLLSIPAKLTGYEVAPAAASGTVTASAAEPGQPRTGDILRSEAVAIVLPPPVALSATTMAAAVPLASTVMAAAAPAVSATTTGAVEPAVTQTPSGGALRESAPSASVTETAKPADAK